MTDPVTKKKAETTPGREGVVHCRRLHLPLPISEHKSCPYCFGKLADIKTGDHEKFCDFCEGKDPINFGFPET